jgi:hypothetical protein
MNRETSVHTHRSVENGYANVRVNYGVLESLKLARPVLPLLVDDFRCSVFVPLGSSLLIHSEALASAVLMWGSFDLAIGSASD